MTRHIGHGVRLQPAIWDQEYRAGQWSYMASDAEAPRYEQMVSLCARHGDRSSLLDVGCGDGVLWRRLAEQAATPHRYLGIDLSAVAVEQARCAAGPGPEFRTVDYDLDGVDERFQLIVFNETLAYFRRPARTLRHALDRNATPDARVAISLWDQQAYGDDGFWRRLLDGLTVVDESERTNPDTGLRWRAKVVAR